MDTYLIIIFLLVVLAYAVAIVIQKMKGRKDVRLHMTRHERDALLDEIESIEIPALERWSSGTQDKEIQDGGAESVNPVNPD